LQKKKNNDAQQMSTKRTIIFHLNSLNIKRPGTYDFGNPGPGLRQTQTCGGVKPNNGITTIFLFLLLDLQQQCTYKQMIFRRLSLVIYVWLVCFLKHELKDNHSMLHDFSLYFTYICILAAGVITGL